MNDMTEILPAFGPAMLALTDRQRQFVICYIACNANATKGALMAGYAKGSAHVQGCRLLKDDKIQAALAEFTAPLNAKLAFEAEDRQIFLAETMYAARAKVQAATVVDGLRAIDIGNRMDGIYVTKVDISDEATFEGFKRRMNDKIIDVTPEDLQARKKASRI